MPTIMIQGCGSDVGKTVLVAGLCRLLANRGFNVRPFKPQNMSNNAAVTPNGDEVGRSTALQALACRVAPSAHMNPVLLKPQSDLGAQLIVRGQRVGDFYAKQHGDTKRKLLDIALESFATLRREADWVVVEGAGSPAETNLRPHDIANMGFARAANVPVVLVGDIDRGHVIASLVGAHAVLDTEDRAQVRGFIINKFRGELSLFAEGITTIEQRTGWRSFGVLPWLRSAMYLPEEDGMKLPPREPQSALKRVRIVVARLKHIANFDDFDPLRHEPHVDLEFIDPIDPLPLDCDLLILPGSKSTLADLAMLRDHGWHHDIHAYVRRGGRVLGICAGYQMLGRVVRDPLQIESALGAVEGLGLLDVETEMTASKVLRQVSGVETTTSATVEGYEMHVGRTTGVNIQPMIRFADGRTDGARQGRVMGCHLHKLFESTAYRTALLSALGAASSGENNAERIEGALNQIATSIETHLSIDALLACAG